MIDVPGMGLEQAAILARTVLAAAGPGADADALVPALAASLPWWVPASCEQVAREAVLLHGLLGPASGAVALTLCLARPVQEPVWADFRRLTVLLDQLHAELRAQRRRARVPGPAGRRAAAEAAGTTAVLARAAAEFGAAWSSSTTVPSVPAVGT